HDVRERLRDRLAPDAVARRYEAIYDAAVHGG
ncbi:MAG: hypothetical protein RL340_1530, partial [Gemmatimonadota bacterium]